MTFTRRTLLASALTYSAAILANAQIANAQEKVILKNEANKKGLSFGTAANSIDLKNDQALRALILEQCDTIVPEWEMKWGAVEEYKDQKNYDRIDRLVASALEENLKIRGHTVIWHNNLPDWVAGELAAAKTSKLLTDHTTEIMTRYKGYITEWDVLNEAIKPQQGMKNGFRKTPFWETLGESFIDDIYHAARAADENAKLFYNDFSLYEDTEMADKRRTATLNMLEGMKKRGVPIDCLGLQSHLRLKWDFNEKKYETFLKDVSDLGLELAITELDVTETGPEGTDAERDEAVTSYAARVLDVALANTATKSVTVWGMSDKYSYITKNSDYINRGTPFDENLQPKPMVTALQKAFQNTSPR